MVALKSESLKIFYSQGGDYRKSMKLEYSGGNQVIKFQLAFYRSDKVIKISVKLMI